MANNNKTKNIKPKADTQKKPNTDLKVSNKVNTKSNTGIKLEIICISAIFVSLILFISIFFNGGGFLGNLLSSFLKGLFGIGAYILPIVTISFCVFIFFSKEKKINIFKFVLSIVCFFDVITFFHIFTKDKNAFFSNYLTYLGNEYKFAKFLDGGAVGAVLGDLILKIMGTVSSYLFLIILFVACIVLLTGKSFFVSVKKFIANISNYFYYEYPVKEEYEDGIYEDKKRTSIFSILKDKIVNLASNSQEYEEDFEEEYEENFEEPKYEEIQVNKKNLKKQKDFIYDGMDKYIKMELPTFFKITDNNENKNDGKIVLAIDEINKVKLQKQPQNNPPINELPDFFNRNNIKNRVNENINISKDNPIRQLLKEKNHKEFVIQDYYQQQNNIKENLKQENFEYYEDNFEKYEEASFEAEQNEYMEEKQEQLNKKIKRDDFLAYNLGQTIYEIDFDIPSKKEIDELFSIPPENALSENTNFDELNKIDLFYDFNKNIENVNNFEQEEQQEIQNLEEENYYENIENVENIKNIEQIINYSENLDTYEDNNKLQENYNLHSNIANNAKIRFNTPLEEPKEDEQIIQKNQMNNIPNAIQNSIQNNVKPINSFSNPQSQSNFQKQEPVIIRAEEEKILKQAIIEERKEYLFPKLSFLNENTNPVNEENDMELRENSNILIKTLKSFNVNAEVINISKGPSVTRYELSIEDGIKVSKILGLADNLALSLAASAIRIEAPIPGKSAVGIEIPNKEVTSVFLSEVICSEKFQKFSSKVSFGIGKDITGNVIVTDIAKMPHMLIAGATGSGKSVCINTLITSILYKASPEEVRLMMIDPKVVELSVYNGIPHLLTPVVTEPEKAAGVLNWAVSEMMERYNLFAQTGTRNLVGYNQLKEEKGGEKLPQIVIIIDELADLMMVAAKEVESAICRLAQLARAAGIHLIIATQRPSVDVITGLIKANVPSRIAFAVSSGTDSRTVIDSVGAEKLLGKGDMLFKAVDMNKALRIQGAFISDKEVEQIVSFIKENNQANYDESIISKIENSVKKDDSYSDNSESDELTEEVIAFLVKKGKASTSMIQRQFRIGYNRAARIIEELEDRGIIGCENGSKQREVLMDKYQYEEYLNRYDQY